MKDENARADEKFYIGQRVRLSYDGVNFFMGRARRNGHAPWSERTHGVVFGFPVDRGRFGKQVVRVIVEGNKVPMNFHMDLWKGA